MNTHTARAPFSGVAQIVAFNWPRYALAIPVLGLLVAAPFILTLAPSIATTLWAGAAAAAWWSIASLLASHWVYDRSGLYALTWLDTLAEKPRTWATIHAGLDEFSASLEKRLGQPPLAVLDIYDHALMPEPSIARARSRNSRPCIPTDFRHLPLPDSSCNAVFLLLAAHELRSRDNRSILFNEVRRSLVRSGHAIVIEHLRDPWNFAAFGPGFLHFFSRREWLASFGALRLESERALTPFLRIFILTRIDP